MVDGRCIALFIMVVGLVLLGATLYPRHEVEEPVLLHQLPAHPVKIKITPPLPPPPGVPDITTFTLPLPVSPGPVINPAHCPRRYLHTNTHVYGRHHNQLQEFANALAWAADFQRTFVLGYFRHNRKWLDPREMYNFSLWRRHYCFLYPEEFIARFKERKMVGDCYGQEFKDTPIGKATHMKCTMQSGVPKHFSTHLGVSIAARHLPAIRSSPSEFLNLSGQFAFFLRPGLDALARVFGLLLPADDVGAEVKMFQETELRGKEYFGVHLRHREGSCQTEMRALPGDQQRLQAQCRMAPWYVSSVMADNGASHRAVFVASDHQNVTAETALTSQLHAATMYRGKFPTKELGGMKGLATDFFLLVGARWFAMNQVSSISQNACYARLGRGGACHGVVAGVIWMFANRTA